MESRLQARIIRDLKKRGYIPVKIIRCNLDGFPDILALKNRVAVFIEVKDKGRKARPLQLWRHQELKAEKFDCYVIDNWEEYEKLKL
mgnify:CR=1 FL=1